MPVVPAPRAWTFRGYTYPVSKLTYSAVAELEQLIKDKVPDPKLRLKELVSGLPVELARHIWDSEVGKLRDWPPRIASDEGNRILNTEEGKAVVIYHACRKHNAGFDRAKAAEIAACIDEDEFRELNRILYDGDDSEKKGTSVASE